MKKLVFKRIILFEPSTKRAKKVDFLEGINVITSHQANGNDVGKSIILKSLYHSMGADVYFDEKCCIPNAYAIFKPVSVV